MTDPTPPPDVHDGPLPDLGHESLRLSVVAALDDLSAKTDQMAGILLLARTALDFAQTFLGAVVPLQQALVDVQQAAADLQATATDQAGEIADLQARVSVLETPA